MRIVPLLILLLPVACQSASRNAEAPRRVSAASIDSATARRICQSPDSVIAGNKDCVLLDQSRRGREVRPTPRAP